MTKNRFELDPEKLATTDDSGHRVYLYPEEVEGKWKTRRQWVYWILIAVYLILPWIYINNKPALMLNIFTREFTFFGSIFHGIDPMLIFLVVVSGLFFIAFLTSSFGRVWCGWGCPQTVFIQSLFMKIETFIEGSARTRKDNDRAPWTIQKFSKRALKWIIFTLLSLHIAHTFIGYFIGPRELLAMSLQSPLNNLGFFSATMIVSFIILLDFGWFREQFCIIVCPYGRMQSVIMDENSLVIAYDAKRGEPRRGSPGTKTQPEGDCINCYNCVKVCPTGIDIRHGTQMECIACTQCIDACDEIMIKVKRPTGLIRYSSENELNGKPWKKFSARSVFYILTAIFLLSLFTYFLRSSENLQLVFLRGQGAPFTVVDTSHVRNHFSVKISHQGEDTFDIKFEVADPDVKSKINLITPATSMTLDRAEKKFILFFNFDRSILTNGTRKIKVNVVDRHNNNVLSSKEVTLVGP